MASSLCNRSSAPGDDKTARPVWDEATGELEITIAKEDGEKIKMTAFDKFDCISPQPADEYDILADLREYGLSCASPSPEQQLENEREEGTPTVEFMPSPIGIAWTGYAYDTVKVIKEGSQAFWSGVQVGWMCTHVIADGKTQEIDAHVKDHCFNLLHDAQELQQNYKLIFRLPGSTTKRSSPPSDSSSISAAESNLSRLSCSSSPRPGSGPQELLLDAIDCAVDCYDPRADLEALLDCDLDTLKRDRSHAGPSSNPERSCSPGSSPLPELGLMHNFTPAPEHLRSRNNAGDLLSIGTVVNVYRDAGAPARAEIINVDPTDGTYAVRYRSGRTWCPVPRECLVVLSSPCGDPVGTIRQAMPHSEIVSMPQPRGQATGKPLSPGSRTFHAQQPEQGKIGEIIHGRLNTQFRPGYRPTLGLVFIYEPYGWIISEIHDRNQLSTVQRGDIVTSFGFRQIAHIPKDRQHQHFVESMEEFGCAGSIPVTFIRPYGMQGEGVKQNYKPHRPREHRPPQKYKPNTPFKKSPSPIGRVFVGGLHPKAGQHEVREYFRQFGTIESIDIPRTLHAEGTHRGFCFISFKDPSVVKHVCRQRGPICGRPVDIKRVVNDNRRRMSPKYRPHVKGIMAPVHG